MIVEKIGKEPMELNKIRPGTVFTSNGESFLKGTFNNSDCVINLKSGKVITPTKDIGMSECYIYPKATIKLIPKV